MIQAYGALHDAGTLSTHFSCVFIEENALGRGLALLDGAIPRPYTDFTMFSDGKIRC